MEWAVEVEDMTVAYDERPVLWDVDMQIPKGSLAAIVGPNGAGKSTLIKAILGLLTKISGSVKFYLDGRLAVSRDDFKRIAYVPQSGSVDWDFPTTVLDVVLMGRYGHLGWFKRPGAAEREMAMDVLRKTGMEAYVDRQISRLSGGQQQRVFLARALIQEADFYFMDEPFKGLYLPDRGGGDHAVGISERRYGNVCRIAQGKSHRRRIVACVVSGRGSGLHVFGGERFGSVADRCGGRILAVHGGDCLDGTVY